MQQRIDQIISELLALKEELNNQSNPTESQIEQPTEQPTESAMQLRPLAEQSNQPTEPQIDPQIEHTVRRRTNRAFPLNKSKFLNVEQRDQVLQYASDNKETIMNQPRANRIQYLQNLVREQLNINLSLYMAGKLIQIISSNN